MADFKWLRNPKLANGLTTTYVSHKGNDSTGDGTATKPYKTIAKATSEATAGTNIMLDDGIWSQQRTLNNRAFKWWGNGKTTFNIIGISFTGYSNDTWNFIEVLSDTSRYGTHFSVIIYNSIVTGPFWSNSSFIDAKNSRISINNVWYAYNNNYSVENCILINCSQNGANSSGSGVFRNNIIIGTMIDIPMLNCNYNNYTTLSIPTSGGANSHSINDASTKQTVADYFNNAALGDYTAKAGSANLGAGFNRHNIGFGLGLTLYATDPAFLPENGAVLRNVHLVSNRFELKHRGLFIQSATDTTVVLDSSASSVDDYYNGLVFAILDGTGEGIMREISDYDGTTKTITVASLGVDLDTTTFYSISGRITSGVKDFGAVFKIARNQLFGMFGFNEVSTNKWTEYAAINPKVASFRLKHSITDSLDGVDYKEYGFNGELLSDGTYGDADDDNNQANNKMQWLRTIQFDAPILIDFPL